MVRDMGMVTDMATDMELTATELMDMDMDITMMNISRSQNHKKSNGFLI